MASKKTPVNWWRVAASIAVPLFLYTTWRYAESEARYRHLMHHLEHGDGHDHSVHSEGEGP